MNLKVTLTHPGTQHAFKLAEQLERVGHLDSFITSFAINKDSSSAKILKKTPFLSQKIHHSLIKEVPQTKIKNKYLVAISHLLKPSAFRNNVYFHKRNASFQRKISHKAIEKTNAVIGFDTASWDLAKACKKINKPFFLDLSAFPYDSILDICDFQKTFKKLQIKYPQWHFPGQTDENNCPTYFPKEAELATFIVVASSLLKRALIEAKIPEEKIHIIPFGVDLENFHYTKRTREDRPLRFAYIGNFQGRKGLPILMDAWKNYTHSNTELLLIGSTGRKEEQLIPTYSNLKVIKRTSHKRLQELLSECDVLIFPSCYEGFGLVVLEAMASGMPVIGTDTTSAKDIITEGKDGFIIKTGNVEAISERIKWFIENKNKIPEMSLAARATAEKYSWEAYGDRWKALLDKCLS